jgi:hypothetical protein
MALFSFELTNEHYASTLPLTSVTVCKLPPGWRARVTDSCSAVRRAIGAVATFADRKRRDDENFSG